MNLLRITMNGEESPYYTISRAFGHYFVVDTIWWEDYTQENLQRVIIEKMRSKKYDACFMQIQRGGVITPETARRMSEKMPVFNWTGDVRSDISFLLDIAPYVTTLFTNTTDVDKVRGLGFRSDYLQVGYDDMYYSDKNQQRRRGIVFCGNNYNDDKYPLTNARREMVLKLKKHFGREFHLYGNGWDDISIMLTDGYATNKDEAYLYNKYLVSINYSHFDYGRYHSDRLLREMACGSLVMSHNYKDLYLDYEDGKHLVTFSDTDDLIKKCEYYLSNPEECISIGKAASEYVSENCRWVNRVSQFLEILKKYNNG